MKAFTAARFIKNQKINKNKYEFRLFYLLFSILKALYYVLIKTSKYNYV